MSITKFSSIEDINSTYREKWKNYRTKSLAPEIKEYFDKWPIQYDTSIRKRDLLFVGLNPSYDEKKKPLQLSNANSLENQDEISKAIKDERTAQRGNEDKERYSYYSLFPKICKTLQLDIEDWNHIDLLPFRQRNQNRLISDFQLDTNISDWVIGGNTKKDIIKDCVSIFLGLIEYLRPKVIVVVNGFISKKIIENTGSYYVDGYRKSIITTPTESEDFSLYLSHAPNECHRILKARNEYPLLLSSMVTGQRALDLGSRERLIWHIGQILVS
jgi:hypothetical protein